MIFPQALRSALPGTNTMLVDLLKSTSLLVTISAAELMSQGQLIASETFRALEVYVVIAALYFALCYPLSQGLLWFERQIRAGVPLLAAPAPSAAAMRARPLLERRSSGMTAISPCRSRACAKSFDGRLVLDGVDLQVPRGTIVAIIGSRAAAARRR